MTLDEVLKSLFPTGHLVVVSKDGWITGSATRKSGGPIAVIGVANGVALGTAGVLPLAAQVLQVAAKGGDTPILVLVDTQGQLMARRDEMRGLNEYLGHLAKCLLLASHLGHRTIGLEYGKAAAGSFLATALATDVLIGLPGAEPAVMDMPSIARVTKLPEARLLELAKTTPVFAPGLDHMVFVGAVAAVWDPKAPLDAQLELALADASPNDTRDVLGAKRKGRPMAADVASKVVAAALATIGQPAPAKDAGFHAAA
jgi:malonate decarboxylase gamma subunit